MRGQASIAAVGPSNKPSLSLNACTICRNGRGLRTLGGLCQTGFWRLASLRRTLPQDPPVRRPRLVVGLLGRLALRRADVRLLLLPALVDRLEAPFRRALAGTDRL